MQLPADLLQKSKNILHAIQGLAIFVACVLTIAVFTMAGSTDGRTGFYFAMCFITPPALVYQAATSLFPRTRKFANPYAFAIVDVVFTILWFSAFIAVATWTNAGIDAGEAKKKDEEGCAAFGYGSEKKCELSQVQVGLGVMIFFLFLATTCISLYTLLYFRRNGSVPNSSLPYPHISAPIPSSADPHTKYAFSTNPHDSFDNDNADDDDDDEEDLGHPSVRPSGPLNWHSHHDGDDEITRLAPHPSSNNQLPRRPLSWEGRGEERYDISYRGTSSRENKDPEAYDGSTEEPVGDPFREDLALSHAHGGYAPGGGGSGRVEFPEADYS